MVEGNAGERDARRHDDEYDPRILFRQVPHVVSLDPGLNSENAFSSTFTLITKEGLTCEQHLVFTDNVARYNLAEPHHGVTHVPIFC